MRIGYIASGTGGQAVAPADDAGEIGLHGLHILVICLLNKLQIFLLGSGREDCATVLGRSGVLPYVLDKTLEIPGGMEPVAIALRSSNGNAVRH